MKVHLFPLIPDLCLKITEYYFWRYLEGRKFTRSPFLVDQKELSTTMLCTNEPFFYFLLKDQAYLEMFEDAETKSTFLYDLGFWRGERFVC